ncbi:alpha/beta fold hydrolase [Achromobacter sp. UMC46]|uniref:alpha/beta fold hydrolase n=1 Tax=Achromobacter sp. UMC46 TaxID=1862319 RepID=UPI0016008E6A|nr:alpha/beta hydrolase [Achromobacter sp. UMC46]MBB1596431.1 alpha/beta hydrolase [Achromobacter sp. UMC46]
MTHSISTFFTTADAVRHQYVLVDGARLHCAVMGDGPPVLLIPGWPQTWFTWRHTMKSLAQAGYTAIAVDPPGTGDSSRPAQGYDTGAVASVLHRLMGQLGHTAYQVVGHDIGMWVAYAMASDFPEAIRRLVLTEAVIPGLAPAPPIFVPPADNIFLWHFMFNQVLDLPEALIAGREHAYLGFIFDKWSHRRDRVAADVYIDAYSAPGALRSGFAYYRAIPETIRQNQERAKVRLRMPVLAIGTEHATRDAPLITMRDNATDLTGVIIPDCGHFVTEECHEAFSEHLLAFLSREG